MNRSHYVAILLAGLLFLSAGPGAKAQTQKRPMTFMDVMEMRSVSSPDVSVDGRWLLYTLSVPDWQAGKNFTDIYLTSTADGLPSTRQLTFTREKNELSPHWSRDGQYFAFLSDRDAPKGQEENQLYVMRPDGGEAHKVSEAKGGVESFAFSRDGKWLAFTAGKPEDRQVWVIDTTEVWSGKPVQLTKHSTPIESFQFSPDSSRIYFLAPDAFDRDNVKRKEDKFGVMIRNEDNPPVHLWGIDTGTKSETRITSGTAYSVSNVTISDDSNWIGFRGVPNNRYERTVTEWGDYADLYLLNTRNGNIERLTNNLDISESPLSFSPDSSTIAFSASDNFTYFRNERVYVRPTEDAGGKFKKIGGDYDGDESIGFWSRDGKTIYFDGGKGATEQVYSLSVDTGHVSQLTDFKAITAARLDKDSNVVLVNFTDSTNPSNIYTVGRIEDVGNQSSWKKLTDSNPQAKDIAVGETEAIQWKSTDGQMVEGILVKPLGYQPGKRYPLIVQIHGGPAGASLLNYNANYGTYSNVFAAAGYACLLPNYRGSTNYGEKFKMEIKGAYFPQGYDDIITGVDYLIKQGIADPDKLGAMGWSAGGHWSNWILTHTHRFKAISSGAGAVNWTSMYAQSDIQRNREYYFLGKPYDNYEHYWDISPLKYIKFAQTPTLIHVVYGDPRVPRPQSEELYMALRQLGVPTEFMVYPGNSHGIPGMRDQMTKMVAEFNWFQKWINGQKEWFDWKQLVDTVKPAKGSESKEPGSNETPDK